MSPEVQEVFAAFPEVDVLDVGLGEEDSMGYFILSPIVRKSGVSNYTAERVFRHESEGRVRWSKEPPASIPIYKASSVTFMSVSTKAGLNYGDPSFVPVMNVELEEFRQIVTAWEEIQRQRNLKKNALGGMSFLRRLTRQARSLERALEEGSPLRVSHLMGVEYGDQSAREFFLSVDNSTRRWLIVVSLNEDQVVIRLVGESI